MTEINSSAPAFQNIEAEQALLGAILIENADIDRVAGILRPDHFSEPLHGRIFEMMRNRIDKGHLASPVVLKSLLDGDEGLKALGGPRYLANMAGAAAPRAALSQYAKLVIEQAARRAVQEAAQEALHGLSAGGVADEVAAGLLHRLNALPEAAGEEATQSLSSVMRAAVDAVAAAYQGGAKFLSTGIPALDRIIRGLGPADLMLLGGATSMGKSAVALEIAANVAIEQGKSVVFVSLEMEPQQLANRIAASRARINYSDLRDPEQMPVAEMQRYIEAGIAISDAKLRIVPRHVRDIASIHAACRRASRENGGLDLAVVDYAQLVRAPGKSRYDQMTEVSIGLKGIAKMLGVPVIALVQIDRNMGEKQDTRPQLNDIRETGQFEMDADQVVFCHREAYYLERRGPTPDKNGAITDQAKTEWEADLAACRNTMELIVRKNRHGALGMAKTGFHAAENRFWPLTGSNHEAMDL